MSRRDQPPVGVSRRLACLFLACLFCLCCLAGCQAPPPAVQGFTAAQVVVLRDAGFREGALDWEMDFSERILFETDSDELGARARLSVERLGRTLAAAGVLRIRVEGHADSTGVESYNQSLSLRRARAVAERLVAGGLPVEGVQALGFGSRVPVAGNDSAEGRAGNRRVAVVVPVP